MSADDLVIFDKKRIRGLYNILLRRYGPQGWWPLRSRRITACCSVSRSIGFNSGGYHPGIHTVDSRTECFEIAVGAVLTQNTNWNNAAAAVDMLIDQDMLCAEKILSAPEGELAEMIRSSGYYNQKAVKLKAIADFFCRNGHEPCREELLSLWGIGPETADSILLYAFRRPVFVIDAYTRRILSRFSGIERIENISYERLQASVQSAFYDDIESYMEYHALLVLHAKKYCLKKAPLCTACPVARACKKKKMFAKQ